MAGPIGVVFNPNSKKNLRDPGRFLRLQRLIGDAGEVHRTKHVDAIADVVHDLLDREVPYWVADGGDGAFHWLVNVADTVVRARGKGERIPGILPTNSGTIDFMARKAGLKGDAESLLRGLVRAAATRSGPERIALDSLRLVGTHAAASEQPGAAFERVGFASALAGVGQGFFDKFYANGRYDGVGVVETVTRILSSAATHSWPLRLLPLPTAARSYGDSVFAPATLDVYVDGEKLPMHHYRAVNAGAIDINLAGIFRLFPLAGPRGVMHVQAGNPDLLDVIRQLPRMAAGATLDFDDLVEGGATELRVDARGHTTIDPVIDGELFYGLSSVTVTLGPEVEVLRVDGER